jgi:hypothetical protein
MKKMVLFLMTGLLLLSVALAFATPEEFKEARKYEHVVFRGSVFQDFWQAKVPIKDIVICAYDPVEEKMNVIPFQIDERVTAPDPFSPSKERASYFLTDSTSGYLDMEDELVCMVKDLGPKAPVHIWLDEKADSTRYEVVVFNFEDKDKKESALYGYVFRGEDLSVDYPSPRPYNFQYDEENDVVSCVNYSVGFGENNGLIDDIMLNEGVGGTGVDIFDSQKLRIVGVLDFGIINIAPGKNGEEAMNDRDNFYLYPFEGSIEDGAYLGVTRDPIVRLVREVHQTLRVGTFNLPDVDFFVETKFYPYSGFNSQGANLNPDNLREQFPEADDILIDIDLVRQSFDFNENAKGMKFFNRNNANVVMDGVPDNNINDAALANRSWMTVVDTVINDVKQGKWVEVEGISEWTMASGDQGTVFSHIKIEDTSHERVELYYHDSKDGGQDDDSYIEAGDTGDGMSFGDQGIKIINTENLDLNFAVYFVDGNKDQAFGELMASNFEVGVQQTRNKQLYSTTAVKNATDVMPQNFDLKQNYPNPFNNSTRIDFELPHNSNVELEIIDLNGRVVKTLISEKRDAGAHSVTWNGKNEFGADVPTGVYIYRIHSDDFTAAKKLLLVK